MGVRLDNTGLLAHYAEWVGRRASRVVAGLGPEDGTALLYAADELLVSGDLAAELARRYCAQRCGERLKFLDVPRVAGQEALLELAAVAFLGDVVVTSDMGAAVAALAAQCRLDGRAAELVAVTPGRCRSMAFEGNNSFGTAALMEFQASRWSPCSPRSWGPGTYDAAGDGYFRLQVPQRTIYTRPAVTVSGGVEVTLYDERRDALDRWIGVDELTIHPPEWSTCYLTVTGPRYRIGTAMWLDTWIVRGVQREIEVLPKWWADPPPLLLREEVTHYLYEPEGPLLFADPTGAVEVELMDRSGDVIRTAASTEAGLVLDTSDLQAGQYVVQVTRGPDPTSLHLLPPVVRAGRPAPDDRAGLLP
ncbi:hypothetical protein ACQPXM_39420 [Kribbella sp. CA-253562]|uniref:hypothetical protein n=1 Tax=Kribbella sp. CA-253562 TaxID=3239942 RepID=UPI003D8DCB6A